MGRKTRQSSGRVQPASSAGLGPVMKPRLAPVKGHLSLEQPMQYVRVTKQQTENENPNGIYDGYWVEGYLVSPPKAGERLRVARDVRNGLRIPGFFETSKVLALVLAEETYTVLTENSRYLVEYIAVPDLQ